VNATRLVSRRAIEAAAFTPFPETRCGGCGHPVSLATVALPHGARANVAACNDCQSAHQYTHFRDGGVDVSDVSSQIFPEGGGGAL
jgi:hypothetical protein